MKDLNLIPKSYFEAKKKKRRKILIIFACIIGFLILAFSFIWPIRTQYALKKKVEDTNKKASETFGFVEKKNLFDSLESVYTSREAEALKIGKYENDVLKVFELVQSSMPEKMYIKDYKFTGKDTQRELTINCVSDTKDEAVQLVNSLRNKNYFKKVGIISVGDAGETQLKDIKNSIDRIIAVISINY